MIPDDSRNRRSLPADDLAEPPHQPTVNAARAQAQRAADCGDSNDDVNDRPKPQQSMHTPPLALRGGSSAIREDP